MFTKPFHIKSNVQMKGSQRKKLRAQVLDTFPGLSSELWCSVVPPQSEISVVRAITHCGQQVVFYQCDKVPVLIEVTIEEQRHLVPTVYLLWHAPDLLPAMVTHDPVVDRLRAGADLMLPGVIADRRPGRRPYGRLTRGQLVSVATVSNRAPVGVGVTARCSEDMYMAAGRGKAVLLLHVVGDNLWREGSRCGVPQLGAPDLITALAAADGVASECVSGEKGVVEGGREVGDDSKTDIVDTVEALSLDNHECQVVSNEPELASEKSEGIIDMDQLLYDAFRQACKSFAKKLEFPILVSSFYAKYMQPSSSVPLDVKKSSYKKISKFLDAMQKESLVEVKELSKGVQSIISFNIDHPEIQQFRLVKLEKASEEEDTSTQKVSKFHTKAFEGITELYAVSGNVAPLFKTMNANKGDVFSAGEVRQLITNYVKMHELIDPNSKMHVVPDPLLAQCVLGGTSGPGSVPWPQLHEACLQRMSPVYRLQLEGEKPLLRRGAVPCVELSTALRSGNKKVTHVLNLPVFGIDPHEFAHRCQLGVGASTSVGEAAHRTSGTVQVMVQGNQVRFVGRLLQEEYHIPKRFISGLDKASKK